jgi:hypothetical protein
VSSCAVHEYLQARNMMGKQNQYFEHDTTFDLSMAHQGLTTGMGVPAIICDVFALKLLQKSIILTPSGPSA